MTEEREKKLKEYFSWTHPFAVAVYNISKEFNIGSLLRTAHCAKAKEFFLIGEKSFNTYASVSSEKWTEITYFETMEEFLIFISKSDYNLILVEQSNDSVSLFDFKYPKNPLFLLGKEKGGLPDTVKNQNYPVLEIPQYGLIHSLNLSCSGSIVIYHYLYQHYKGNQ
ncbi:MAG: hypothetical protein A3B68_07400 [Candidatus Melainabacteria bacterium RIFCSPHIGHO2_02_FULL_34_12]|nr:MAG: hypothetical protein A3B68_07400 [Candidatus Melainabacteria bacterium RIFCSPHIGHO2_02_FULL_34_12]